jgi:hypothetical protein
MSRSVAFAVVLSLVGTTPALAGETLLQSATRAAQALARTETSPSPHAVKATASTGNSEAQEQPGLQSSGLRKRTKIMIAIGAAAAYAAIAYSIDRNVVNTTPSTLGTRKD